MNTNNSVVAAGRKPAQSDSVEDFSCTDPVNYDGDWQQYVRRKLPSDKIYQFRQHMKKCRSCWFEVASVLGPIDYVRKPRPEVTELAN